jgi:hypothetical protein
MQGKNSTGSTNSYKNVLNITISVYSSFTNCYFKGQLEEFQTVSVSMSYGRQTVGLNEHVAKITTHLYRACHWHFMAGTDNNTPVQSMSLAFHGRYR